MASQQHNQGVAAAHEQSVLAMLRALVPNRPLTPSETLRIAELHANHLLRHFQIDGRERGQIAFTHPVGFVEVLDAYADHTAQG